MSLTKEISIGLKKLYDDGMTQDQLAKRADISQAHINRLLNGRKNIAGLSLETVDRIFPNATINLYGDKGTISNNGTINGSVAAVNNGTINHGTITQSCFDAVTDKILKDNELTAEEKVKVLGVLRK